MNEKSALFTPPPDAEAQWQRFEEIVRGEARDFFDGVGPIAGARAPGRLDVMGGVADYSGCIVLEMPIAEAAFVAWQWREDRVLRIRSLGLEAEGLIPEVALSLDELVDERGRVRPVTEVRERLSQDPQTHWVRYIAGCFYIMLQAYSKVSGGVADARLGELGANILVCSDVPLGAGVSSSAAIEVATMHALSEAAGSLVPARGESGRGCALRHHGSGDLGDGTRERANRDQVPAARHPGHAACSDWLAVYRAGLAGQALGRRQPLHAGAGWRLYGPQDHPVGERRQAAG